MARLTQANTIAHRFVRLPYQWRSGLGLGRGLLGLALVLILWSGYILTSRPVTLVINGQPRPIRTHHRTVEALMQEMGLALAAEDIIDPLPSAAFSPGDTITIQLARPVTVEADNQTWQLLTHEQSVGEVLAAAGLVTNSRDEILIDGEKVSFQAPLPPPQPAIPQDAGSRLLAATTPRGAIAANRPEMVRLIVHRSVPVTLNDGQANSSTFYTARPNVGEALLEQGITLFLGDKVTPSLGAQLSPGMQIYIERSVPVTIKADGHTIETRTRRETIGQVLADEGVALMGQDFSLPPADHLLEANETVEVVRVRETFEIEEESIPFETKWVPDEEMELDQQEVRQAGGSGVIKTRTRVRYENGQEVWREIEDEWLDQEPNNRVIAYGAKIVVRTLNTEGGPIEYWRKIPMVATAYSAATSGKAPDHPRYGITRSGLQAGYGIVAVDPRVIPLMTNLYVPGYGRAVAGDTGGRVLGKRIDLGFDDDQPLPVIYGWRDVYLLTPVPSADEIRYVLPQWPQE